MQVGHQLPQPHQHVLLRELRGGRRGLTTRRIIAAGAVMGATLLGCFASLDGFSGGPDDSAGGDARTEAGDGAFAADGAVVDVVSDAPAGDGGTFCKGLSPQPTFCDDFDTDGTLVKWVTGSAGKVEVVPSDASAPRAIRSTTATKTGTANAYVSHGFPGTARHIHHAFDMRVGAIANQIEVSGFVIQLAVGYYVSMYVAPNGETGIFYEHDSIADAGFFSRQIKSAAVTPFGVWKHYDLDVDLADVATPTVTLKVSNVAFIDHVPMDSGIGPGAFVVQDGIGYVANAVGPCTVDVDNIVVDLR